MPASIHLPATIWRAVRRVVDLEASRHVIGAEVRRASQRWRASPRVQPTPAIHQVSLAPIQLAVRIAGGDHHGPGDKTSVPVGGRAYRWCRAKVMDATPGIQHPAA